MTKWLLKAHQRINDEWWLPIQATDNTQQRISDKYSDNMWCGVTYIDKRERSAVSANFNTENMFDLTGEDVDWRAKRQSSCQRLRQVDSHKAKLEQTHCYLHMRIKRGLKHEYKQMGRGTQTL